MTALERVMQLKGEGRGEGEIIATLRAEGVAPMQISDAINQSKIKEAVTDPNPTEGMTPSIMPGTEEAPTISSGETQAQTPAPQENVYTPEPASQAQAPQTYQPQAYDPQPQAYAPQEQYAQDPYQNQGYDDYSQGGYDDGYGQGGYGGSTDTMIEVAEQVFSEKIKKLSSDIKALTEFKAIFEVKVENMSERLKRMEKHFDSMQLQILEKVGEYGKSLSHVKKEMGMIEDSFSKFSSKL